jgi:hypothetical protein
MTELARQGGDTSPTMPYTLMFCLLGVASLVVSIIALVTSRQALDEARADQQFFAVIRNSCLVNFKQPVSLCNTISFQLQNMSRRSQEVIPRVESAGICVHSVEGACPTECQTQLRLLPLVLQPSETFEWSFKLHTRSGNPETATVVLYAGEKLIGRFNYKYEKADGIYRYYE